MRPSLPPRISPPFHRVGSPASGARRKVERSRRAAGLLALGCLLSAGACGSEDDARGPGIRSFDATPPIVTAGSATSLTAIFTNGSGTVDHGVGSLESGVPKSTGALDATTTFTLTVTGEKGSASRTVAVTVVPPPVPPVITAPPAVTAGATGSASVPELAGTTFEWAITGGSFSGGGGTAAGSAVTFTAGAAGTLQLSCVAVNAAGTGSAPSTAEVAVVPPPVVSAFAATASPIVAGGATSLVATFTGGSGAVDHGVGAVTSGVPAATGSLWDTTTFLLTVTNAAGDSVTASATVSLAIVFKSEGATFAPVIVVDGSPAILWTFADGTTSTSPTPSKTYGSAAPRLNRLLVTPWSAVRRINLGYNAADGGSPYIERVPDQNVSEVQGLRVVRSSLGQWCSSFNEFTSLDFGDFTNLDTVECYRCEQLASVNLANTPSLSRASFESCRLGALDVSQSPGLTDLRAAVNAYETIEFGGGAFPDLWHICIRDNEQLTVRDLFADTTRFPNLAGFLVSSTNQAGALRIPSSHPTLDVDFEAAYNGYTSVDLRGALQNSLGLAYVRLDHNPIAHIDVAGCAQITELDLRATALSADEQDALLATLDGLGRARLGPGDPTVLVVDLQENVSPSAVGRAHAVSLASKGWTVRTSFWTEAP